MVKFVKLKLGYILRVICSAFVINSFFTRCSGYPTTLPGLSVPAPEIIKFMKKFGYLDARSSDSEALYHESAIIDAIKNIQKFGALSQSGILDNETLKLMVSPRCGVPDIETQGLRAKRYVVGSKRWRKRNIKYFIANWSGKVGEDKVIKDMARAFHVWSQYSGLKFKRVHDPSADIIVAFGSQYHGDNFPFDGPGNILAHAFYPYEMQSYGGDIHFDEDENWKENSTNLADGVDFFSVAVHELGHSLGLAHSPLYSSIMFPYYKGPGTNNLDYDDIIAMYELYVKASFEEPDEPEPTDEGEYEPNTTQTPDVEYTTITTPSMDDRFSTFEGDYETVDSHKRRIGTITTAQPRVKKPTATLRPTKPIQPGDKIPDVCEGHFDSVSMFRGDIFIFKGKYVWRLSDKYRIMAGYPVKFRDMFPFLPENISKISASYERSYDNAIVIFSGKQYWVYDGQNLIENSPRAISQFGLSSSIEEIDAAMFWPKNQRVYLFANNQFWRYNENIQALDPDYPKNMTRWNGIPSNIDAATTMANGKTYFFKDNLYWLYNNKWVRPERGFPRRASNVWLGCPLMLKKQQFRFRTKF